MELVGSTEGYCSFTVLYLKSALVPTATTLPLQLLRHQPIAARKDHQSQHTLSLLYHPLLDISNHNLNQAPKTLERKILKVKL
jgi:hypothetical protein